MKPLHQKFYKYQPGPYLPYFVWKAGFRSLLCSGRTGHAEGIKIEFNPNIITFQEVLEVFFATHDPTTLNRQGNDVGTQYRSTIFKSGIKCRRG